MPEASQPGTQMEQFQLAGEARLKERLRTALITNAPRGTSKIDEDYMIDDVTKGFGKAYPGRVDYQGGPETFAVKPEEVGGVAHNRLKEIMIEVLQEKLPGRKFDQHNDVFINDPQPGGFGSFSQYLTFNVRDHHVRDYRDIVRTEEKAAQLGANAKNPVAAAALVVNDLEKGFHYERTRLGDDDIARHSKPWMGQPEYPAMKTYDALIAASKQLATGTDPKDLSGDIKAALTDQNAVSNLKRDLGTVGRMQFGANIQMEKALNTIAGAVRERSA